ncbi:DUF6326 family protein [Methanolobus chelungpuianus]|uniref:Uncharacterized protein n=1 Tax=Methanolobus chelungpuianus TaxID=502115 RepID=A0AAE3KZQ8_9EURY|nr:DUF6326 family protein [Methanolobus chelungpuianus]MCQ6963544.1 hypothetical protein [Methanolobus chelungpuianus]
MEDWKIRTSVLWLLASIAFLAHQIIVLMEPGVIAQLMAGEAEGQRISPGMILFFSILILVPMVMAFLSLTLKDPLNRRLNILVGAVFALLWSFSVIEAMQSAYWGGALITLSAVVASALIVRYARKHRM